MERPDGAIVCWTVVGAAANRVRRAHILNLAAETSRNSHAMPRLTCPTCNHPFDSEKSPDAMPFCSQRCRQIDLGRWLNEEHSLPIERDEMDDEDASEWPDDWRDERSDDLN